MLQISHTDNSSHHRAVVCLILDPVYDIPVAWEHTTIDVYTIDNCCYAVVCFDLWFGIRQRLEAHRNRCLQTMVPFHKAYAKLRARNYHGNVMPTVAAAMPVTYIHVTIHTLCETGPTLIYAWYHTLTTHHLVASVLALTPALISLCSSQSLRDPHSVCGAYFWK